MNCVERIRICERRSQGWMCPVSSGKGCRDVGLKFQFGCAASMAISAKRHWPPGLPEGGARQSSRVSSESQTVGHLAFRRPASNSPQFFTRYRDFAILVLATLWSLYDSPPLQLLRQFCLLLRPS